MLGLSNILSGLDKFKEINIGYKKGIFNIQLFQSYDTMINPMFSDVLCKTIMQKTKTNQYRVIPKINPIFIFEKTKLQTKEKTRNTQFTMSYQLIKKLNKAVNI